MPTTAREHARELAARLGVSSQIDWTAADQEIDRRGGVARQIRLRPDPAQ
jgi:hypothetical protein